MRRLALVMPLAWLPIVAPAQERASAIGLDHESATDSHRGFDAEPLPDVASGEDVVRDGYDESEGPNWAEANRRVGEIGGWRAYARELFEQPEAVADDALEADPSLVTSTDGTADVRTSTGAKPAGDRPMAVDADAPAEPPTAEAASPEIDRAPPALERIGHESVLEDYAGYEEANGPDWIEANRRVGEIGGWRTYARELFESGDDEEAR